jgi:AraC-like DNA-binding protein
MKRRGNGKLSVAGLWEIARAGDLPRAIKVAGDALVNSQPRTPRSNCLELHLVRASCLLRQGHYADAARELDDADRVADLMTAKSSARLRVNVWRAELAYFQGRYSEANDLVGRVADLLEQNGDLAYVAFALRIRIAILLARTDYAGIAALADRAIGVAEASGDDYVIVQILNILGAARFDLATSKLGAPHARAHLTSLDLRDAAPMEADAREALQLFKRARDVAMRANYHFAAWYVDGNIERLDILLGNAARAVPAIRKRLGVLQSRGAKYDEIVTRSNLAWALRSLGRQQDALHELDVALQLARDTGTFNVLLDFLEYDRSIVLGALGDTVAAGASYRRYRQLVSAWNRSIEHTGGDAKASAVKRPLDPYPLKRADRYVLDHLGERFTVAQLAEHCGVSWRTLEKAFADFRGVTPVAYVRNLRLDRARDALKHPDANVAAVAARYGFRSSTTFALEYRKRFGITPSRTKRSGRSRQHR